MELELRRGDYVPDGAGGLCRVRGEEELLQRVLFKLTARRGSFPFLPDLGSRLWQLGRLPPGQREGAAKQYAAEALAGEELAVESVTLTPLEDGASRLTAALRWRGQTLTAEVEL